MIKESSDLNCPRLVTIEEERSPWVPPSSLIRTLTGLLESHDSGMGQSRIMCLISLVRQRGVRQRRVRQRRVRQRGVSQRGVSQKSRWNHKGKTRNLGGKHDD